MFQSVTETDFFNFPMEDIFIFQRTKNKSHFKKITFQSQYSDHYFYERTDRTPHEVSFNLIFFVIQLLLKLTDCIPHIHSIISQITRIC